MRCEGCSEFKCQISLIAIKSCRTKVILHHRLTRLFLEHRLQTSLSERGLISVDMMSSEVSEHI